MKKIVLAYLGGAALVGSLFFFLAFNEEIKYSCDPVIDVWVKKNKDALQKITRLEFNQYPVEKRVAIFRALDPQKREALWLDKFHGIVNGTAWSQDERTHITRLVDFIKSSKLFYQNKIDRYIPQIEAWAAGGIVKFNWKKSDIIFLTATLFTSDQERKDFSVLYENLAAETKQNVMEDQTKKVNSFTQEAPVPMCLCNVGVPNNCVFGQSCVGLGCTATTGGCGLFSLQACNGKCI